MGIKQYRSIQIKIQIIPSTQTNHSSQFCVSLSIHFSIHKHKHTYLSHLLFDTEVGKKKVSFLQIALVNIPVHTFLNFLLVFSLEYTLESRIISIKYACS